MTVEDGMIITPHVLRAEEGLARILKKSSLGAVLGPAGSGKTSTVKWFSARLNGVQIVWVESSAKPTQRQLLSQIAYELTGEVLKGTRYDLDRYLVNYLRREVKHQQILLVVDEGQRLSSYNIEDLRFLHDRVGEGFSLVILGGNRCRDVIEGDEMLNSRIRRKIDFRYLELADAMAMARVFHSIYVSCSDELLEEVNRACFGQFRNWDTFTDEAASICEDLEIDTLTPEVMTEAMKLINGSDWEMRPKDVDDDG